MPLKSSDTILIIVVTLCLAIVTLVFLLGWYLVRRRIQAREKLKLIRSVYETRPAVSDRKISSASSPSRPRTGEFLDPESDTFRSAPHAKIVHKRSMDSASIYSTASAPRDNTGEPVYRFQSTLQTIPATPESLQFNVEPASSSSPTFRPELAPETYTRAHNLHASRVSHDRLPSHFFPPGKAAAFSPPGITRPAKIKTNFAISRSLPLTSAFQDSPPSSPYNRAQSCTPSLDDFPRPPDSFLHSH